jgi:DNA-binding MarR family transcriptional regulator
MLLQALLAGSRDNNELAAFAGVSPSAMTRLVDGLAKHGWVRRHRSDEDRRRVLVELTARGKREASRLRGLTEHTLETVLGHIPAGKHQQVLESLQLVRAALERSSDAVAACCAPGLASSQEEA